MTRQRPMTGVIPPCFPRGYDNNEPDTRLHAADQCMPLVAEPTVLAKYSQGNGADAQDFRRVELVMSKTIPPMPCERVKAIREGLGLTQVELAEWLRLSSNGKYAVSRWELGRTDCPGPVSVALEAFEAGWRPGQLSWPLPGDPDAIRVMEELEKAVLQAQEHVRNIRRTQGV